MAWAIIDSGVYIGYWRQGLHQATLSSVRKAYVVRHSAVVLSELRRGARTQDAQRLVEALHRVARSAWEPMTADWWEAGRLVRVIGDAQDWEVGKRRDFQNDALIALTARRHGAAIVTSNNVDFELLARHVDLTVVRAGA